MTEVLVTNNSLARSTDKAYMWSDNSGPIYGMLIEIL